MFLIDTARCDLLKKCYLCSSNNNFCNIVSETALVVICSKNVTFAVATTIQKLYGMMNRKL